MKRRAIIAALLGAFRSLGQTVKFTPYPASPTVGIEQGTRLTPYTWLRLVIGDDENRPTKLLEISYKGETISLTVEEVMDALRTPPKQ